MKRNGFESVRKRIAGRQLRGFMVYVREKDEVERFKKPEEFVPTVTD